MVTVYVSRVPNESPELRHDRLACRADLSADLGTRKLKYAEGFNPKASRCVGSRWGEIQGGPSARIAGFGMVEHHISTPFPIRSWARFGLFFSAYCKDLLGQLLATVTAKQPLEFPNPSSQNLGP